jgi:tetraacyldisaccharide 4'-kinase
VAGGTPAGAVALTGIAQPARFVSALEAGGWNVAQTIAFPDHHPYSRADLVRVERALDQTGAAVVLTTAKDAMRLLPLRPLPVPVGVAPLAVSLDPEAAFTAWLAERMAGRLAQA